MHRRNRWSAAAAALAAAPAARLLAPALLGAGWLLAFFAPLLSPDRALANRDIFLFHLPLRTTLRRLAAGGLPVWNPWLNGGQPLLSNPSYAAWYPPTWLGLVLPPAYALDLLVVLHAALAFGGAWMLARRLGAGRGAAALAAVGFSGSGPLLSLVSVFTLFCGMAWFPWVLAFGDAALREEAPRRWLRPALLAGLALGLQLLNGEPSTVVVTGLGLLALAVSAASAASASSAASANSAASASSAVGAGGGAGRAARPMAARPVAARLEWRRGVARALRVLVPVALGLAIAAIQLLPTAKRVAGSQRAGGVWAEMATTWSAPPERLAELVFPRFFGDPARLQEGYFFGRQLNDNDFPYLLSLYPGLLLTVLGVSALALWPIPRRAAWVAAAGAGAFLAVGRHNPFYEPLRRAVPALAALRFPEKFALLAIAALGFAGALGWQRLQTERRAGRPQAADLPLALALVLLVTALGLAALLYVSPGGALWLVQGHSDLRPGALAHALAFLRREAWAGAATCAAVAALLALCRARRPSAALLHGLALALLTADLWHYGRGLVTTLPADLYRLPPPLVQQLGPTEDRIYLDEVTSPKSVTFLRRGDPGASLAEALRAQLRPYSAVLWGVPYALNEDYDLILTRWGNAALEVLHADLHQQRAMAYRFLGAWNVGTILLPKPPAERVAELARDPLAPGVRLLRNPFRLPRYRFVPRVSFHPSYGSALYIARTQGYAVDHHEHCVRAGQPPATITYASPPEIVTLADTGGAIALRYRAASPAFFTVAMTFDEGWRAAVDGLPRAAYPTAVGQLGVELPAGEHLLELDYHQSLLPAGAAITLAALAACGAALGWTRNTRSPSAA
ncbi:MAG TPA: hypothetical protein VHR45_21925 [Thermoanaerobaculia bacterium]|nr:hypothetical protein [Thermoanaerobaculia bacterium]